MAEINIEKKEKKSTWPWLLLIAVLLIVGYFVLDSLFEVENGNIETEPAEGEVMDDNELNYNQENAAPYYADYGHKTTIFYTL
ncbi:MAG: hypothetical protein WBB45_18130 [Cyclobacteriaceae bacterium]